MTRSQLNKLLDRGPIVWRPDVLIDLNEMGPEIVAADVAKQTIMREYEDLIPFFQHVNVVSWQVADPKQGDNVLRVNLEIPLDIDDCEVQEG